MTLDTTMSRTNNLSSPIHKLPYEILSLVFLWCLEPNNSAQNHALAIAITAVCSYWRDIGLATPQLWDLITWRSLRDAHDRDPSSYIEETERSLDRFTAYLARSKDASIDVRFEITEHQPGPISTSLAYRAHHDEAWKTFCDPKHARRCRTLHLYTIRLHVFLLPLSQHYDRLEVLDMDILQGLRGAQLFKEGNQAPLKELRLRQPIPASPTFFDNVRTDRLEKLTIVVGHRSLSVVLPFLARCPVLVDLDIEFSPFFDIGRENVGVVALPSLRSLRVSDLRPEVVQEMIIAPNMTSLAIQPGLVHHPVHTQDWNHSPEGVPLGGGRLQELEVACHEAARAVPPVGYIRGLLAGNPSLKVLRLSRWKDAWEMVRLLGSETGQSTTSLGGGASSVMLVSDLERVELQHVGNPEQYSRALGPLLRSRPQLHFAMKDTPELNWKPTEEMMDEFEGRLEIIREDVENSRVQPRGETQNNLKV